MGGEGSIAGMIRTIKNNELLLSRNKRRRAQAFGKLADPTVKNPTGLKFKSATEEELQRFREQLELQSRRERKFNMVIYTLIAIACAYLLYEMLRWMGFSF